MLRYYEEPYPLLTWGEADTLAMAKWIGPDAAVTQRMPYSASVVRLYAKRFGEGMLSKALRRRYARDVAVRESRAIIQHNSDALTKALTKARGLRKRGFTHQRAFLDLADACRDHVTGWLVADDVGVGKTWQALMWAHEVVKAKRVLVVTKNIAKAQWVRAITNWINADERIVVVEGTRAQQAREIGNKAARWCVAHWESLPHHGALYRKQRWDAVVLDEAHMIANRNAQRTMVAHTLRSAHRMALTAHPWTNDVGELWSILAFLYPEVYTSYWRFFHQYVEATPREFGGFDVTGVRRPKLLQWELAPFLVRRLRTQVYTSLPPLTRVPRTVALAPKGRKEYERLRKEMFAELEGEDHTFRIPIINDFVRLTRLRQYIIDPGLLGAKQPSLKYPVVHDIMSDVRAPVVVFSEFREALERLAQFLRRQRWRTAHIRGGMRTTEVRHVQDRFLAGKLDAVLVVAKAGDTALNLGKYGYCIHLDLPWNPRGLEQREGRVDRPEEGTGALVPTTSFYINVEGTYEDRLMRKLEDRHDQFGQVFTRATLEALFR